MGVGGGGGVVSLMESGRDSVALFEEIGDYVTVEEAGVKWGGRGDEWYGFECVSVCDATLPSRSQVASVNQCFKKNFF